MKAAALLPGLLAASLALGILPARAQDRPDLPRDPRARAEAQFRALIQRGRQALKIEEFHGAKDLLERAARMRPGSPEAQYLLARAWAGLKQVKQAEVHYHKVLEIHQAHAGALQGLATIAEGTGRYEEAEGFYRQAIQAGAEGRARRSLASLLARQGRGEEAERILLAMLEADPSDTDARFELGLARALVGNCASAIPELRAVVEAEPRRVPALFQLGNCLSRAGRPEEATEVLESFRRVKREEMEREERERLVHFTMLEADRLAAAGDLPGAVAKSREAVAADPGSARAHAFLGSLLLEAGDDKEALRALMEAARLDPSDAIALTEVGRLLVLAGRVPEAVDYLIRATEADKNLPEPHRFLAILYKQAGRDAEAERHREAFLRLKSKP